SKSMPCSTTTDPYATVSPRTSSSTVMGHSPPTDRLTAPGLHRVDAECERRRRRLHRVLVREGAEDVVGGVNCDAEPVVLVAEVMQPVRAPDVAVIPALRTVRRVDQEVRPLVREQHC